MGIHTSVKAHINVRRPTLSVETDTVHEENEATNISSESSHHQVNLSSTVPTVPVRPSPRREDDILLSLNLKRFQYNDLKTATKNFHDGVSSEGGFGCFFKGWIDEHSFTRVACGTGMAIAVRRLDQSRTLQMHITDMEWLTEVNRLGQLGHPNLLKAISYCIEHTASGV